MAINARFSKVARLVWIRLALNLSLGIKATFWLSRSPWSAPGGHDRASGGSLVFPGIYWKSPPNLNRRTARWHANLQEYDYEIRYIPGKTNVPPDALSCPPGADHGDRDNQNIALVPKGRFKVNQVQTDLTTFEKRVLMAIYHDHPSAGHPGRDETLRQTRKYAQWPGMEQWIADYVKRCSVCQQNKTLNHPRRTPLYRITTEPQALPFQQVCMDLITGLPPVRGLDAILTIVNHGCSQSAIFLPCSTTIT